MNNKVLKRIGSGLLSVLMAASVVTSVPHNSIISKAASITLQATDIDGAIRPSGKSDFGYKSSDSHTLNNGKIQVGTDGAHKETMWFNGGSGSSKCVYCIEPGRKATIGDGLKSQTNIDKYMDSSDYNKEKYIKTGLTWFQKERLIGYITGLNNVPLNNNKNVKINNNFTISDLQNASYDKACQYYESYLVTQILIWEVILGERDENFIYQNFGGKATHVRATFKGSTISSMKSSYCGGLAVKGADDWGETAGKAITGTPNCLYAAAVKHIQGAISKTPSFANSREAKASTVNASVSNGKYVYTLNNTANGAYATKWTYALKYTDGSSISSSAYIISKTDKKVTITFNNAPTKDVLVTLSRTHQFASECGGSGNSAQTYYQDTYHSKDPNKTIQAFTCGYKDPRSVAYVKLAKIDKATIKITKKVNNTTYLNAVGPAKAYTGLRFKVTGPNNYSKTFEYKGANDTNWVLIGTTLTCTIRDIDSGSYTVEETSGSLQYMSRPANYTSTKTVKAGEIASFDFTNTMNTAKLRIVKYSADNDQVVNNGDFYKLTGAQFAIQSKSKLYNGGYPYTVTLTKTATDSNGKKYAYIDLTDIPLDTYTVTEIKAPEGHKLTSPKYQTKEVTSKGATYEFKFTNPVNKIPIRLLKLEKHYKSEGVLTVPAPMANVDFCLFKGDVSKEDTDKLIENKKYIEMKTTDEEGYATFSTLPYGTYTIVEKYDPNGANANYPMMPPKVITLNSSTKPSTDGYIHFAAINIEMSRGIQAIKKDAVTGQTITDEAEFGLGIDENGNGKYDEGELICKAKTEYGVATFTRTSIAEYLGENGDITKYFTEDENKMVEYEGKPYYVVETKAPVGYKLNTEIVKITHEEIEKINSGNKVVITKTVEDYEETGNIKLKKTGETLVRVDTSSTEYGDMYDKPVFENKGLSGVVFEFTGVDGKNKGSSLTRTTDKNGEILIKNVAPGTYSVKEIECPDGFILDDTVYTVTVKKNETAEVLTKDKKTINNLRQKVQIALVKSISGNENADKSGIVFGLYAESDITLADGTVIIPSDSLVNLLTCDADGNATSNDNIPYGKYYAKELKTIPGYNLTDELFEVTAVPSDTEAKVTVIPLNEGEPIVNYPKSGNLIIVKSFEGMPQDAIANLEVPGEIVTSEDAQTTTLKYTLAAGYDKTTFEQMAKELSVDDLAIMEYIDDDGKTVTCFGKQGIPFRIQGTGENGTIIDEVFYTDENGRIILYNIPVGTYTATEIGGKWTSGYVVEDKFEFSIVNNETTEKAVLNKIEKGKFRFTKTEVSTGTLIPNCWVTIRDENHNTVFEGATDENGVIEIELAVGKYTYQETMAPYGYIIDEGEYPFEIKKNEVCKAKMENAPITADVEVIKLDKDDHKKALEGAEFAIYSKDDLKNPLDTVKTDKNGKASFKMLRYGEYVIKEIKAPKGYSISSKDVEFKIDENKTYKSSYTFYDTKIPTTGIETSPLAIGAVILGLAAIAITTRKRKYKEFK